MSSAEVYGRLLAAPTIERGVEVTLRHYLGPYLGEVLEQAGEARDALPDPDDLARVSNVRWPVPDTLALVIVATPGTTGDAVREPSGYRAMWDVRCGVIADLGDRLDTREAAQFYAAAAGAALAHQGVAKVAPDRLTWLTGTDGELLTLEGSSVRWVGEAYSVMDRKEARTLIVGEARVVVTVEGARSLYGGPVLPPIDPTTDQPSRDPAEADVPAPVTPSITLTKEPL